MEHFDGARHSPNSIGNSVWHALNEPVCQYLRTRNPRCLTVYKDNSLGPLARDSPCRIQQNSFFPMFTQKKESVEGIVQSVQEYWVNEEKNCYAFRCICKIASSNYQLCHVCVSVCLSAQNNLDHTGWILMKFDRSIFSKI